MKTRDANPSDFTLGPNGGVLLALSSCGPLPLTCYRFTITDVTTDVPEVASQFLASAPIPRFQSGPEGGSYNLDLDIDTPYDPPFSPGGWQPGPNKHIDADGSPVEITLKCIWGYEDNGPNNYVDLNVTIPRPPRPKDDDLL